MIASGLARLHSLTLDGELIGVLYALQRRRATYFYASGYVPELRHLSLGSILIEHAFAFARRACHHTFDFLAEKNPINTHGAQWTGNNL